MIDDFAPVAELLEPIVELLAWAVFEAGSEAPAPPVAPGDSTLLETFAPTARRPNERFILLDLPTFREMSRTAELPPVLPEGCLRAPDPGSRSPLTASLQGEP